MNLTAGTALQNGKYVLQSILGQGELGMTFKATQAYLNQLVVLKTLQPNPSVPIDRMPLKQQFVETARQVALCQHPGLVRVLDLFEESGLPFVVLDCVVGQSLLERVQSQGPLTEPQAIQYIRQIGSALSVLHRQNLVHQDVNPQNLICPPGANFVVLVDFQMLPPGAMGAATSPEKQSANSYRAIECTRSPLQLTSATDVYALAATLYFLVTGQHPLAAGLRTGTSLISPRQFQPGLSPAVEAAILSGMAMNATERPSTIAAWFAHLPGVEALPPVNEVTNGHGTTHASVQLPPKMPVVTNGNAPATLPSSPVPAPSLPAPTAPVEAATTPTRAVFTAAVPAVAVPGRKSRMPKAIAGVAAIALASGLGLGLTLRFSAVTGIGPKIFKTQQTFPPRNDWSEVLESPVSQPVAPLREAPPARQEDLEPIRPPRVRPSPAPAASPEPEPSVTPTVEATPAPTPSPVESTPPVASPSPEPVGEPTPPVAPPELPPPTQSNSPETAPPAQSPNGSQS